eukprot:jgi/Tetstr1/454149/TSEL_041068.t1
MGGAGGRGRVPFPAAAVSDAIDVADGRLRVRDGASVRVLLPGGAVWADADVSPTRRHAAAKGGGAPVKCKRKNYGVQWAAVARTPDVVACGIPFAAPPTRSPGSVWATRFDAENPEAGWILLRMGEDGVLRRAGAPRVCVDERALGRYGVDHGEIAVWRPDAPAPRAQHVLVRHPVLGGEWYPARRANNRWWMDYPPGDGAVPPVMVRDPLVGMPGSVGTRWRPVPTPAPRPSSV